MRGLFVLVICFGVLVCLVGCIASYYCLLVGWYFSIVLLVWLIACLMIADGAGCLVWIGVWRGVVMVFVL